MLEKVWVIVAHPVDEQFKVLKDADMGTGAYNRILFGHVVDGKYVKHTAIADNEFYLKNRFKQISEVELDTTQTPWRIGPVTTEGDIEAMKAFGLIK